jgi:hypothetical protein
VIPNTITPATCAAGCKFSIISNSLLYHQIMSDYH